MGRGIARALAEIAGNGLLGYGGMDSIPFGELDAEREKLFGRPDHSSKLLTDFSDKAVRARLEDKVSGIPAHLRPGHASPDAPTSRDMNAASGIAAIRHPPAEDIQQT